MSNLMQRLYTQRGVLGTHATGTDKLRASKRARDAMQAYGIRPDSYPIVRDFMAYCARTPETLSFKGLDAAEEREMYNRANRYGYRWREVVRSMKAFFEAGCDDDDLQRATLRAIGGRWQYIHVSMQLEEYWQYTPKESWAEEYRVAGKALLDYCVIEKQWK